MSKDWSIITFLFPLHAIIFFLNFLLENNLQIKRDFLTSVLILV